jgi:hypothetical protein
MKLSKAEMQEILDRVADEGSAKLLDWPSEPPAACPESWLGAWREAGGRSRAFARAMWSPCAGLLPMAVEMLESKLMGLMMLSTRQRPLSLVYLFEEGDEIFAYRGGPPAKSIPASAAKSGVDTTFWSKVHDGWVDLYSEDTGPLPTADWQEIRAEDGGAAEFLVLFSNGPEALGVDLVANSASPKGKSGPLMCRRLAEDGIEEIGLAAGFWGEADSWIAATLEDLNEAPPEKAR